MYYGNPADRKYRKTADSIERIEKKGRNEYHSGMINILFIAVLALLAVQDWNTMKLSDRRIVFILYLTVGQIIAAGEPAAGERLIGMVCVSGPMLLITMIFPGAFGGGDIKLMAAGGLFLKWRLTLLAAVLAIFSGGVYCVVLLILKKKERKEVFPFGPFLCFGLGAALIWGKRIWRAN